MRILPAILAFAPLLSAQTWYTLEDHACLTATAATRAARGADANSGGMKITCASPHNFAEKAATMDVSVPSTMADGDSLTINAVTYTFRRTLVSARDIKLWNTSDGITSAVADNRNVAGLVAAINGESGGYAWDGAQMTYVSSMAGTYFHADTTASSDVEAINRYVVVSARSIVGIRSKTLGTAGKWVVSKTGSAIRLLSVYHYTLPAYYNIANGGTMEISWWVTITGSTGDASGWAKVGTASATMPPVSTAKVAVLVDADEFRLPAVDSSGFPDDWAATQQATWRIVRSVNDTGGNAFPMFEQSANLGGVASREEGALRVDIPACGAGDSAAACGLSFVSADASLTYMRYRNLAGTVTVADGVATASFLGGSSWTTTGGYYKDEAIGTRIWIRGFHKYYETRAVTAVANNGSGTARVTTSAAHSCVNGTDSAYIDWASGPYTDGTFTISVISGTTLDLTGTAYSATATGTLTCNPHGRQAVSALGYWSTTGADPAYAAAPRITALDANTISFDATGIPAGTYTGTCAAKCVGGAHATYAYVGITAVAFPFVNFKGFNNDAAAGTDKSTWPNSKLWWHGKKSVPLATPPRIFRYWVRECGKDLKRHTGGTDNGFHQGTYVHSTVNRDGTKQLASRGHMYDRVHMNQYNCAWSFYDAVGPITANPGGIGERPVDIHLGEFDHPVSASAGSAAACCTEVRGINRPYVANLGSIYISWPYPENLSLDTTYANPELSYQGTSLYLGKVEMGVDTNQPWEWVRNRTGLYAAARYATGGIGAMGAPSLGGGYEATWDGVPFVPTAEYFTRYSTTGSLRAAGWSTGSTGGTCSNSGDGNTTPCTVDNPWGASGVWWQSPNMAQAAGLWLAVRPRLPIIAAANSGESNIIQFKADVYSPSFQVGDAVTVAGASGGRDGSKTISALVPRKVHYTYLPDNGDGNAKFTQAGTLSGITVTGANACRADFTVAHNAVPGMLFGISDTNNATLGQSFVTFEQHKKYTVASVVDADTLDFTCTGIAAGTTITNRGACPSATTCWPIKLEFYPGVQVSGGANSGAWSGGGTFMSNEENRGFAEIFIPEYTAEPAPSLSLDLPASVNLTVTEGATNQVVIPFSSVGGILDNFSASDNQTWASVTPTSGTVASNLTVTVDAAALMAGSYSANVTVASTTAGVTNTPRVVTVNVTVTAAPVVPTMSLSALSRSFTFTTGGTVPPAQTVTASCTTPGCTVTRAFTGCAWLTVTPTSGTTPRDFTFTVDPAGLAEGSYSCPVTMTGTGEVNDSPQIVNVALAVEQPRTGVNVTASASDTRILLRISGDALASGVSCTAEITAGGTIVASGALAGGRGRSLEFSGFSPSTLHSIAVNCGVGVGGSAVATTRATDAGTAVLWPGTPPTGATKMHIQYGPADGDWTNLVYDCTGKSCASAAEAPSVVRSPGRILYLRRRWLTGAQDENTSTATAPFGPVRIIF